MKWIPLTDSNRLEELSEQSKQKPVLIFKHSTTCPISKLALDRLQSKWEDEVESVNYFVDLFEYRSISNLIAKNWNVRHESPQAIILCNDIVWAHFSHLSIDYSTIKASLSKAVESNCDSVR